VHCSACIRTVLIGRIENVLTKVPCFFFIALSRRLKYSFLPATNGRIANTNASITVQVVVPTKLSH